jgi:hypothetical protein
MAVIVLSRHLPSGNEEIPVTIAGASTEIRTGRLLNTSRKRHRLRQHARWDNNKVHVPYPDSELDQINLRKNNLVTVVVNVRFS